MSITLTSTEGYTEVSDGINLEDASTILDYWSHAIRAENLHWRDVVSVMQRTDGSGPEYGFYTESDNEGDFDILFWLGNQCPELPEVNVLTAKTVLDASRGIQGIGEALGVQAVVLGGSEEESAFADDVSTGFLDGDEDGSYPAPSAKLVYKLEVVRSGQTFSVPEGEEIILGRGSRGVHVQILGNPSISRVHAKLWIADGKLFVQDLGSAGGTLVNSVPISGPTKVELDESIGLYTEHLKVVEVV